MNRTDNPFAADQQRAWLQAIEVLELDLGTHARPPTANDAGLTWRQVYKNTPAVDVWRRSPTRQAVKPEGDELKQARRIVEAKLTIARLAVEALEQELEALK